MAKGIWRRQGDVAVPVGNTSREFFAAIKDGDEFIAETRAARNVRQLRLFWALCELVADNDTTYDTKHKAKNGLLRATQHVDIFFDKAGKMHIVPKSIRIESMPQEEFSAFFQAAVNVVCEWLGNKPKEIIDRVNELVGDKRYEGYRR